MRPELKQAIALLRRGDDASVQHALGLLPLALGRNAPGQEIEGPLAIVILGGLVTSTILNLLVLPTLALRFGRFEEGSHTS